MAVPSSKRRLPRLQLRVAGGRCFSQNVRPLQDGLLQLWNVGIDRPGEATIRELGILILEFLEISEIMCNPIIPLSHF